MSSAEENESSAAPMTMMWTASVPDPLVFPTSIISLKTELFNSLVSQGRVSEAICLMDESVKVVVVFVRVCVT